MKTKDMIYQKKGMAFSHGLPMWSLMNFFQIELLIESGTAWGMSTEIWSSYSPKTRVITIDLDNYNVNKSTRKRLSNFNNLTFYKGDSEKLMPKIIEKEIKNNNNINIAIFIDGPKFVHSVDIADLYFKQWPQIKFAGLHDAAKESHYHFMTDSDKYHPWKHAFFYTDELWYFNEFAWLDDYPHKSADKIKTLKAALIKRRNTKWPDAGGGLGIGINGKIETTTGPYVKGPLKEWPKVPNEYLTI
jgi:hypothetical protein